MLEFIACNETNRDDRTLYRIAAWSCVFMLAAIPLQIGVFAAVPMPSDPIGWMTLFQKSPLLGLMHMDLLFVVNNVLVAILYLAFRCSMASLNRSLLDLALLLGFLGIAAYMASNRAFEMWRLSGLHAAAETEVARQGLLASAQTMMLEWQGTAFDVYYVLNGIALLLISWVMRGSAAFGRATAVIGLVCGVLMMVPSTAGTVGLVFSIVSLIPWLVFVARCLPCFLRMSKRSAAG